MNGRPLATFWTAAWVTAAGLCAQHDHAPPAGSEGEPVIDRVWRSRTGDTFAGELIDVTGDVAVISRADSRRVRVPIAAFAPADAAVVRRWAHRNRAPEGFGAADREVVISTLRAQMRYDRDRLLARPGEKLRVVLRNLDDMPHNLVFCRRGDDKGLEVAQAAWRLGGEGFARHWIPDHPRVLLASRMLQPRESQVLWLRVPSTEGTYPYVCTFPGHAVTMNGELLVSRRPVGLSDVHYRVYHGRWDRLPDFGALEPAARGRLEEPLLSLAVGKRRDRFGLVFEGRLHVPLPGRYRFRLGSDDGARLWLDDRLVVDNDGVHGLVVKAGEAELAAGTHALRVEFFEREGGEELRLVWSGPGVRAQALTPRGLQDARPIPLAPCNGEAVIYRNFLEGAGPRAIGVGYPLDVNLAFDADHMNVALLWRGPFIDARRHWTGRGQGFEPPAGFDVLRPGRGVPLAELASATEAWPAPGRPGDLHPAPGYRFRGYRLSRGRRPVFRYEALGVEVEDDLEPRMESFTPCVARTLRLRADGPPRALWYRAAVGDRIRQGPRGRWLVDDLMTCAVTTSRGEEAFVRESGGRRELLVRVVVDRAAWIEEVYSWR